ncbi:reverse transcriptase domain-containing protein [Tanacetum coccineum]
MDCESGNDIRANEKINSKLPMLAAPKEKEELIIYLAATKEAISAILMTERDRKQAPIYFVSHGLQVSKINYTPMEKLILALRISLWERPEDDPRIRPWRIKKNFRIHGFDATNNEAEYEALIAGLQIAEQMGVKNLQANVDSRLVANQVNWSYIAKEPGMIKYLEKVRALTSTFKEFSFKQRSKEKSIDKKKELAVVEEEGRTWMTLIYEYLTKDILPKEKRKARAIRRKAGRYVMTNEVLNPQQNLTPITQNLTPITSPWPFYKWGIDIAGPFPEGPGKVKFLIVAIDYFTKWIEAKPVAAITGAQIKKFVWDNIVCRFGLPGEIISDNGKQFRDNPFKIGAKSYVSANALLPSNIRKPMAA